ncbi:MAG: hypothetical protein ABI640_06560 [Gammaproteobacteria bacterium]
MNARPATFMLFIPAVVLVGCGVLIGQVVYGSSRQETQHTGSITPESRGPRDLPNGDWRAIRDENYSRPSAHVVARNYDGDFGPFTREEARDLRAVWGTIRDAASFYDINWRAVGLGRAPGDRQARRFMAQDWGSLRRAERFDDINWRAEYHRR